ncbi:bestrophin family protein [Burkholderia stagnalis]|uniref:bestrophin family protein n=1 Tax=Burkholderia stagnalis TaxID=1503054 RepID=UPI000F5BBFC5|nr:bestrophin family ion channel [Burkholderia stagnalis]RQQ00425.1 hypothetical protein DF164_29775 [Burkholderia stagnalis]RQY68659.1 hypothetical protein DF110_19090 [Burkholderia stagnalis]
MIIRPQQNWFRILFVWHGSILQSIIPQLVFMAIISTLAVFTNGRIFGEKIPLNTAPFTLFGLALAIFLAFRNNASFERFSEARHLWGNMLIASRTLTSQIKHYLPDNVDEMERNEVIDKLIAFVYALKHQLRQTDPAQDLQRILGPARAGVYSRRRYKPVAILDDIRGSLVRLLGHGPGAETARWMFDAQLAELGKTVGGCERILSTPIPFAYSVLLHRTAYAYCMMLPFGLVDSTEFFTPLICVFISYTLIGLEAIASEVAEPFGVAPNALALDAMSRTIERSVLELCDREMPEELVPASTYQIT